MKRGFPEHGHSTNASKLRDSSSAANLPSDGYGNRWFPWCGWLVHTATCEVMPDYSRASKQHSRRRRLTPLSARELVDKMSRGLKPKLHHVFLDPHLNSPITVRRNVFHAFLHSLSLSANLNKSAIASHKPAVSAEAFQHLIELAAQISLSHQRTAAGLPPRNTAAPRHLLAQSEVSWLGYEALQDFGAAHGLRHIISWACCCQERVQQRLTTALVRMLHQACDARGFVLSCRD